MKQNSFSLHSYPTLFGDAPEPSAPKIVRDYTWLFDKISCSRFRSRFHLDKKDRDYIANVGMARIRLHARKIITERLAPEFIPNDGSQTPYRGHPVFKAQHATGCCCRGCFSRWHGVKDGQRLSDEQIEQAVDVLMAWIEKQYDNGL